MRAHPIAAERMLAMGMRTRSLCAFVALLLAAAGGCGGSDPAPTARRRPLAAPSSKRTPLRAMPAVAAGSAPSLPPPVSTKVHDPGLLHTAFESAETMWEREFGAAGSRVSAREARVLPHHRQDRRAASRAARPARSTARRDFGVYLNTTFFDVLARQFGLSSGFAAGYITAHEVAHHVQQLLGVHQRVAARERERPRGRQRAARSRSSCRPTATRASGCTPSRRTAS